MPAEQPDAYPTPPDSSPQPIEPERPHDMQYYLKEGLEDVERYEYRDIRSFKEAVNSRAAALLSDKLDAPLLPYLIFSPVTPRQLANINRARRNRYKQLRFLYLNESQTLIVKYMPSPVHEIVSDEFAQTIRKKIYIGGQDDEITSMRSTTYQGNNSSKEADGSFRPRQTRPDIGDWPTVIIECGVSETPRRLKADARWWFENSDGAVIVVLLLFVSVKEKAIKIELWKRATTKNPQQTRANNDDEVTGPTVKRQINITQESITGFPLKLKFKDIFLSKPKANRGEADFIITEEDLRNYYNHVWPPTPEINPQDESSTEEVSGQSSSSEEFIVD